MDTLFYTFAVIALGVGLAVTSYLDRVYRELGRVAPGRIRANLEVFEADVEPRLRMERRLAALNFSILTHLWLVLVAVVTAFGVDLFVSDVLEALLQQFLFLTLEVLLAMHLVPAILLSLTTGRWLIPFIPVVRACVLLVWPLRAILETSGSLLRLAEREPASPEKIQQEGLEALVEAAEEEGLLEREQAHLIEQVVEFTDKRVREVMTPRPDVVAIPAQATIEQLRRLIVETKLSRIPAYERTLDEVVGVAYARDILQIPEREAPHRPVRAIMRQPFFVPETKLGSQLLKELQQKNQQMAIAIDEYGLLAGVVTAEDLVEEIVGEIGEDDRPQLPDVVRESEGVLLLRGSVARERLADLFGIDLVEDSSAATVAGLLNRVAGHVPVPGERIETHGLSFEVLEANQRKVLRVRARLLPATETARLDSAARAADKS